MVDFTELKRKGLYRYLGIYKEGKNRIEIGFKLFKDNQTKYLPKLSNNQQNGFKFSIEYIIIDLPFDEGIKENDRK